MESQPPGALAEKETAFACIRVVREKAGSLSKPEIRLPTGYELYTEKNYEVPSPAEYYVFLRGPKGVAKDVRIAWPGNTIAAVLHNHARLALRREEGAVVCDIPVAAASLRSAWPTLEVHSYCGDPDLFLRVEHNDPDRRASYYARHPWVDGQAKACLNFLFASRAILRDWGVHRQIAAEKLGHISLMGFESNNPLHGDDPAHWHLIYYWPTEAGSQVPHFYLDEKGRVTSNNVFVFARNEACRMAGPGDPMVFTDPNGKVRFAIDIRKDGGVDIGPAAGQWTYSIVAGDEEEGFTRSVRVLRRNQPWLRVAVTDDTCAGLLTVRVEPLDGKSSAHADVYRYDPLTGAPAAGSGRR